MIAVDTHVVVRLLVQDHELQYKQARKVFQKENLFIPDTVLLETEWVLHYAYKHPRTMIHQCLIRLLGLPNVSVGNAVKIHNALEWHKNGMDFADALHLAGSGHCDRLVTFDKKFISKSKNLSSCTVTLPQRGFAAD